jgi:hypothetical protein
MSGHSVMVVIWQPIDEGEEEKGEEKSLRAAVCNPPSSAIMSVLMVGVQSMIRKVCLDSVLTLLRPLCLHPSSWLRRASPVRPRAPARSG